MTAADSETVLDQFQNVLSVPKWASNLGLLSGTSECEWSWMFSHQTLFESAGQEPEEGG